jgi:hypothetical protein
MSFADQLEAHLRNIERRKKALFVNVVSHVEGSIKRGSAVTGAPGQPVDTANLLNSWQTEFPQRWIAETTTNCVYAQPVEDNERGVTFKNHGAHSVKLTRVAWPVLVEYELRKLDD